MTIWSDDYLRDENRWDTPTEKKLARFLLEQRDISRKQELQVRDLEQKLDGEKWTSAKLAEDRDYLNRQVGELRSVIHRAMDKMEPLTEISEGIHEAFRILGSAVVKTSPVKREPGPQILAQCGHLGDCPSCAPDKFCFVKDWTPPDSQLSWTGKLPCHRPLPCPVHGTEVDKS